jgi:hypothetical protein
MNLHFVVYKTKIGVYFVSMGAARTFPAWVAALEDEDLAFVRRLVLASGSLKEVAAEYDISYPTVRLRLDRLIEKIRLVEQFEKQSPVELAMRLAYAEGKVDLATLKTVLGLYRAERSANRSAEEQVP